MNPTRFSSKPPPPNTFLNFQPAPKTPGYLAEHDRVTESKHLNKRVEFQKEDKQKKEKLVIAKMEIKQTNRETLLGRIQDHQERTETKEANKIYTKATNQQLYEKICHIQAI
jgi:hypothetical protein